MTRQRARFEHIDSHTYAMAPLSAGLAEVRGWVRNGSAIVQREKPGAGHASCHSVQRRLTREELICYLQGLCAHLRGIASAPVLSLLAVATRHRHRDVQRSSGDGFFPFGFQKTMAYMAVWKEQQDLPLKNEGIHVSSVEKMQTGAPSCTHFKYCWK